jgi:hypothetical protein
MRPIYIFGVGRAARLLSFGSNLGALLALSIDKDQRVSYFVDTAT